MSLPDLETPPGITLQETPEGFRLRETDEYVIEVWGMLYNWRLVVMRANQDLFVEHGYCYFGRGLTSLARAIAAAAEWDDPLHTDPPGYDKKAF